MKTKEFKKDKAYEFDLYRWKNKVTTDIGVFDVELQMEGKEPITNEMLRLAQELVEFGKGHTEDILALINKSYRAACKNDPKWVKEMCDVPLNVKKQELMQYVNYLSFTVASDSESPGGYDSFVHIIPNWDEEHALFLRYAGNKLTTFDPMG